MSRRRRHFQRDTAGATAIEYALLACMIGIAVITAATSLNQQLMFTWQTIVDMFARA